MSLETGIPVQRSMIFAISSSVTLLRSKFEPFVFWVCFSSCSSCFLSSGRSPYLSFAAFSYSPFFSASSMSRLSCSIFSRSCWTCPMAFFSFSHCAFMVLKVSRFSASSFWSSARRAFESSSSSFLSAASSICIWMILRLITSSSVGIESISVRIIAQASSMRSMALSGRKRSVI